MTDRVIETDLEFAGPGVMADKDLEALRKVNFLRVKIMMPLLDQFLDKLLLGQIYLLTAVDRIMI